MVVNFVYDVAGKQVATRPVRRDRESDHKDAMRPAQRARQKQGSCLSIGSASIERRGTRCSRSLTTSGETFGTVRALQHHDVTSRVSAPRAILSRTRLSTRC